MPSNFEDGDLIEAGHLKQYSGEAFYSDAQSGSTSSAYLATVTPAPLTAYPVGMVVNFRPNADNSASPTLNVNGLGAKAIVKNGSTALATADIKNGQVVSLVYDGTNFQLVAASTGGSSSVAALNDLTDVTISSPVTGQVLRKSAGDWVNSAIQAGDLPSHNHDGSQITTGQVAPARLSSNAPNASQFLRGDGTWAAVSGGASDLNGLTDVTISSPATGQFLRKSGGDWVNSGIQAGDLPSAIDAAKIGGGSVSNTEFAALDGVTSSIQTQLNGKAASTHTHAASDITSGQLGLARGGTGSDLSATGGAGQVLKQSTAGGAVSVGALAAGDMPSGIDAAKIGGGSVSNTEFATLDGVTSSIQTQLNGKAASTHTHAASDITSGQLGLARGGTGSDLSATGGAGQVLKQSTAGGAVSVGALAAGDMPSGIDAAKIGGGSVSNTEFAALDGVTSSIQTQLNGKAASVHTHAASDITSGQLGLARGGTGSDLSATGGAGQVLKQSTSGGAVSVGALAAGDIPSGIDAAKIGSGAVSNTEFGYLDGVTSPIQSQLNALGSVAGLIYGDGSDGDVTISADTVLTEPKFYNNLTVNGGIKLESVFPIYVKNTLTLNGSIQANGGAAQDNPNFGAQGFGAGMSSAIYSTSRWTGNSGGPGTGNFGLGSNTSTPQDFGAVFSAAGGGGGLNGSGVNGNTTYTARHIMGWSTILSGLWDGPPSSLDLNPPVMVGRSFRGGLGGGGGNRAGTSAIGGGGGGGGGVLRIFARLLAGSGTISANGGKGGNASGSAGGAFGGGGGGGGVVILVSQSTSHSFTLSATGGAGGSNYGSYSGQPLSPGANGFTKFFGGI